MRKRKFSFRRAISRLRGSKKAVEVFPSPEIEIVSLPCSDARISGGNKKKAGARLWMKLDRNGECEVAEWDKIAIINRAAIPARDLRILGPLFSHSCTIIANSIFWSYVKDNLINSEGIRVLTREKAMVVNLEFIKAIITAEEVFLLDPLSKEVLPFVDQLRQQLPTDAQDSPLQQELPLEFQVLEIALEVLCSNLGSSVADLEKDAYPGLDELARNVSTKNLEHVRSLKSDLTRLLARVQKVRDEIEHLLDDNNDMAELYLTRKLIQNQQFEDVPVPRQLSGLSSGLLNRNHMDDVEDLEMLLESYFMHLDRTRNKVLSVREYIDDTEVYVNIQLDHQRNELIQLQLTLITASFAIALQTVVVATFGMNMPCSLFDVNGVFEYFVGATTVVCAVIFMLILGYARWKKLLGS